MKKIAAAVLAAALMVPTLALADAGTVTTKYSGSRVNLRKSASTSASVITKVRRGDKLDIESKSGDWYKVTTEDDDTGYIHEDYVKLSTTTGKTTVALNMRKSADADSKRITTLSKGTKVTILSKDGNWLKVKADGETGYVYGKYVKKN